MPAGIPIDVDPPLVDVLEVLHLVGPALQQEAFADPDRHEVRRRHDDIEAMPAGAHLGQRGVVGIVVGDRHLDLVGLFELLDQVGAGVVAPVVDVELAIGGGGASHGQHGRAESHSCNCPLHRIPPVECGAATFTSLPAEEEEQSHDDHREQQEHGGDRIDFRRYHTPKLAQHVGRKRILPARLHQLGDHHVVERNHEGQHQAGDDARPQQRQRHPAERLPRRGVEIGGRGLKRQVHAFEPRPDRQIGEGNAEGRVRGNQVAEAGIAGETLIDAKKMSSAIAVTISGTISGVLITA